VVTETGLRLGRRSFLLVLGHWLLLGNRASHLGKQYGAWAPLGHFRLESPLDDRIGVKQVRRCVDHGAGPVFLSNRADLCSQRIFWIADQLKRKCALWILPKGWVIFVRRLVDLRVANEPLSELPAVFGRLRADPENGDIVLLIPSVFVDKGRNLGPAPRSPLTSVEKDNRGRRSFQHRWKLHWIVIDIFQSRFGKSRADFQ